MSISANLTNCNWRMGSSFWIYWQKFIWTMWFKLLFVARLFWAS